MKQCKKCLKLLPLKNFYNKLNKNGKSYKRGKCKNCYSNSRKGRIKPYAEEDYFKKIKYLYNLSQKEYLLLFNKQKGKCAICLSKTKIRLCVDHDHITGEVRGLLCNKCNKMLGLSHDNPKIIKRMLKYLK